MRLPFARFTIRSLLFGIALLGILSWVISGLEREGTAWFSQPPLFLVLLSPFLVAAFLTLAVPLIQSRDERT
jgi:cytochrome bd-type quinol oxidase subunit 2